MYERILFPTDGSETAAAVLDDTLRIASEHGATVHVLHVADTNRDSVARVRDEVVDARVDEGERIVQDASDRASDRGVAVVTVVLQGDPFGTIVDYGDEYGVDLIVMPTHGRRDVERFLLGSVTERVIGATDVPVLAVTPGEGQDLTYPVRDVLVPTDGSRGAELALAEATDVAAATGATLHLLHVVDTATVGFDVRSAVEKERLAAAADELLEAARSTAAESVPGAVTTTVAYGRVYREILSYVEEHDVDLVAVGVHGETEFSRYTLGSVAGKIVRTSPVPVLLAGEAGSD